MDKFERCRWRPGPADTPILEDCGNWFAGRILDRMEAGDHRAFLLEPFEAASDPREGSLVPQSQADGAGPPSLTGRDTGFIAAAGGVSEGDGALDLERQVLMASLWVAAGQTTSYPRLDRHIGADVLVVGAEIMGITRALQLRREGRDVVLIDKHRVGTGVTGYTTAKISSLHQLVYGQLRVRGLGEETARAYAAANEAGLERIARLVDELGIDCDFRRRPNYTYEPATPEETEQVQEEAESAAAAGLDAGLRPRRPPPVHHPRRRSASRTRPSSSRSASWWAPPRPWSVRAAGSSSTRA